LCASGDSSLVNGEGTRIHQEKMKKNKGKGRPVQGFDVPAGAERSPSLICKRSPGSGKSSRRTKALCEEEWLLSLVAPVAKERREAKKVIGGSLRLTRRLCHILSKREEKEKREKTVPEQCPRGESRKRHQRVHKPVSRKRKGSGAVPPVRGTGTRTIDEEGRRRSMPGE